MIKKQFAPPELELIRFAVTDPALFLSGFETGEDELDPAYGSTPVYN